jgi:hypothetical protein
MTSSSDLPSPEPTSPFSRDDSTGSGLGAFSNFYHTPDNYAIRNPRVRNTCLLSRSLKPGMGLSLLFTDYAVGDEAFIGLKDYQLAEVELLWATTFDHKGLSRKGQRNQARAVEFDGYAMTLSKHIAQ